MNAGFVRKAMTFAAFGFALNVALLGTFIVAAAQPAQQRPKIVTNDPATYRYAYQHGYRAGYEDGFTKGKSDFNENQPREFSSSDAYNRADRGYEARMGTKAEFEESYRTGFELGYNDGFFGRPFTVSLPSNLRSVVVAAVNANAPPPQAPPSPRDTDPGPDDKFSRRPLVPDGTEMKIRLSTEISTKTNREGDKFTAVVLDPSDFADAVIEGHIAALKKSGKATGKTEMSLAFDTIRMRDGRGSRFAGQVEKVYQSETVKTVDEEGNVESSSRTKDTAVRGIGGGALGAIIGGIAGGGKGAAIGAIIGAGVGAGSVFVQGGKELVLEPGTEILIRTAAPARSRE
jgi:outer membrane lipoprotein SlyB